VGDRLGAVLRPKLGEDRRDMVPNRLRADVQRGGTLPVPADLHLERGGRVAADRLEYAPKRASVVSQLALPKANVVPGVVFVAGLQKMSDAGEPVPLVQPDTRFVR
jgi:hypothetical protein